MGTWIRLQSTRPISQLCAPEFYCQVLQGSTVNEADPVKEGSRPERASVFAKRAAHTAALHLKKPASSVEAGDFSLLSYPLRLYSMFNFQGLFSDDNWLVAQ